MAEVFSEVLSIMCFQLFSWVLGRMLSRAFLSASTPRKKGIHQKGANCAIALCLLSLANPGLAQREPLTSLDQADALLEQIAQERVRLEWQTYDSEVACQQRFFMNACLNKVRRAARTRTASLDEQQVDAEQFKRRERDRQRELERQKKITEAEQESIDMSEEYERRRLDHAQKQAQSARDQAEFEAQAAERAKTAERENQRRGSKAKAQEDKRQQEAEAAEQRANNVKIFEQKQQDALKRQQEMQQRRQQK